MSLTKVGNNLSGNYFYNTQKTALKISGTIDKLGNLTINEFNGTGSITGIFKGQMTNNKITGNWSKPDGSKTMPFSISEALNNQSTASSKSTDVSNWTGTYTDKFGTTLKLTGPASDGAVKFELVQGSSNCAELTEGIAYLEKAGFAIYSEENVGTLKFTYNNGEIELSEVDFSHGASCGSYDGYYKKKKK